MKINWEGILIGLLCSGIMGGLFFSIFGFNLLTLFVIVIVFIVGYYKGCESDSSTNYTSKSPELKNAEHEAYMMGITHGYYSDEARTARQNADIVRAIEKNK